MANERTYPCLPSGELDESIAFYESLGFRKTYRQVLPNPYAVVAREEIHIHLFGIEGFDPAESYGSAIVAVPDPDGLYRDFAAGLRKTRGKLPVAGIPRISRPRKKYGTVRGFKPCQNVEMEDVVLHQVTPECVILASHRVLTAKGPARPVPPGDLQRPSGPA